MIKIIISTGRYILYVQRGSNKNKIYLIFHHHPHHKIAILKFLKFIISKYNF